MAAFNDTFKLSIRDIELIEQAVRHEIGTLSARLHNCTDSYSDELRDCNDAIRTLHQVLGKLHNQKIWYGQVHETGIPISG